MILNKNSITLIHIQDFIVGFNPDIVFGFNLPILSFGTTAFRVKGSNLGISHADCIPPI